MRELSLFTGAGGGLLGTKLLGWKAIGYVEKDPYCQKVLMQRIQDGCLDSGPVFSDIGEFIVGGFAAAYRGVAQVVTAGWPCQPHSVAGDRLASADERDKWPETREVVRLARPAYFLGENVPGLLTSEGGRYFAGVLSDLALMGYSVEWGVFSNDVVHERERLFLLANDDSQRGARLVEGANSGEDGPGGARSAPNLQAVFDSPFRESDLWPRPLVRRMDDAIPNRVDRLKAAGNAQVPTMVVRAWQELSRRIGA